MMVTMSRNAQRRLKRLQKQVQRLRKVFQDFYAYLPNMWSDTPDGNARFWSEAHENLTVIGIPELSDPYWLL